MSDDDRPATTAPYLRSLLRHFVDLRDGTHGGQATRAEKERLFHLAVDLLDAPARRALGEMNADLLLSTGTVTATGAIRSADGGLEARWTLSWPEQRRAAVEPVTIRAHYGRGFHHPHLRGATVGEWPLNVFTADEGTDQLPIMRAIIAADLHNLVYQRDYRIVPATTSR
jgi:hypothetical protein